VRGIRDVTLVQELGQPSLTLKIDRARIARYGLNVADVNGLIQTAIGGDVATKVVQGEKEFDLVIRLDRQYRDNPEEIGNIPMATSAGQQIPLKELADIQVTNGASFIYRENNSRYIGVQFSVEGRDLADAVEDAIRQVDTKITLPQGYRLDWGGEYTEYTASSQQLKVILPLTLPGIAATLGFVFTAAWSELLFALMLISSNSASTFPVGLLTFVSKFSVDFGQMMAAGVLALIPACIFFLLIQRYLVQGLTAGAVKG